MHDSTTSLYELSRPCGGWPKPDALAALQAVESASASFYEWASYRERVAYRVHDLGEKAGGVAPAMLALEARLVTFLIRTHDLLGRMDRAIMDAGFRGGVAPAAARAELVRSGLPLVLALRLNSAVYTADIASVPTLRWLTPLTPLLEGLVLAGRRPADLVQA